MLWGLGKSRRIHTRTHTHTHSHARAHSRTRTHRRTHMHAHTRGRALSTGIRYGARHTNVQPTRVSVEMARGVDSALQSEMVPKIEELTLALTKSTKAAKDEEL